MVQDGDIVNNDSTTEWNNARAAMQKLDGVLPYATVRGNHDIGSQFDFATRFGPGSPYSQQPTLVDHYEVPGQPTWDMRNTVHKFQANGQKLMVLTIDISAGSDVVTWANNVIASNPDYRVILDTHAYLYDGGERFNNSPDPAHPGKTFDQSRDDLLRVGVGGDAIYNGTAYGGQDGETLWNNLVRKYSNISLFLSGHQFEDFDSFKYHLENGINGNRVYELLVDPQNMANGGNGWIRLLEFDPNGTTVHVKTYSPFLNQWDTSPDNFYDIELSSIVPGDFNNDNAVERRRLRRVAQDRRHAGGIQRLAHPLRPNRRQRLQYRGERRRPRAVDAGDASSGGCGRVFTSTPGRIESPENSSTRDTGQQSHRCGSLYDLAADNGNVLATANFGVPGLHK